MKLLAMMPWVLSTGQPRATRVRRWPPRSFGQGSRPTPPVACFVQERVILTSIRDPHAVRMRDLVVEADSIAIIADLVRGRNLRQHLGARRTLAPASAPSLTAQVLRWLAAA